jgi:hypothetical protein
MSIRQFAMCVVVSAIFGASAPMAFGAGVEKINVVKNKAATVAGQVDSTVGAPPIGQTPTADTTCNFVGLANNDSVNNAYAGGTSSSGVSRTNLGVRFTGAVALTSWNGCCSPDANIAYSTTGSIVMGSTASTPNWAGLELSYCSSVALTATAYTSADASGTPIDTIGIPANISSGPYSTWAAKRLTFSQAARSVKITGASNLWGIDTVLPVPGPVLYSVTPNSGSQFGGDTITITGIGLGGATGVTVGGRAATGVTVNPAGSQVTAVTPLSLTSGAKDVAVTTPAGTATLAASFTYLAASPALTITSDAASCTPVGTTVNMNVTLSGVVQNIVAGQISLAWNPAKLQPAATNPISAGDSPFVVFQTINSAAGTATILVSTTPGSTGAPVQSKVVAKLRFVVAAASCDGTGTSVGFVPSPALPTEFTDGFGAAIVPQLVASSTFVVDDGAPVISNVPANVTVQAQAGEGNFAVVTLGTPTVSDACSPTQLTSTRSDGQQLSAKWPVGTTTVTWRAVDPCGNATTATTTVTVQPYNTMSFTASWVNPFGGGAGAVRPVTISLLGSAGTVTRTVNVTVAGNGTASFSVTDLPVDNYSCATLEDVTRSLRRKVAVTDAGSTWAAGNAALVLGDIIADEVVDVLDWGAYVVLNPNADLNSDGVINSTDGNIILANFGVRGDTACGSAFTDAPQPIVAISVQELARMGLPELAAADLNRDGVLDEVDIEIHQQRGQ